jgi:molecular chaperone HtpG
VNVSREFAADDRNIKSALTKRVLDMLAKLAKSDQDGYRDFYKEFGAVLKEGPAEDFSNREAIAKLLRFSTTQSDDAVPTVALEDYVSRMKRDRPRLYICAENFATAGVRRNSTCANAA